jgi:hypothetical protein
MELDMLPKKRQHQTNQRTLDKEASFSSFLQQREVSTCLTVVVDDSDVRCPLIEEESGVVDHRREGLSIPAIADQSQTLRAPKGEAGYT